MSAGQEDKSAQNGEAIRDPHKHGRRPGADTRLVAINRLFRESQGCRSRAEVAVVCLKVAEELTGSRFGFLGELNDRGLLDVIESLCTAARQFSAGRVLLDDVTSVVIRVLPRE